MTAAAMPVESVAEVASALAKSVTDLDASRRVGWAKMYAAIAAGEKAERELAIAREDVALLSMFAGFSWGAMQKLGLHQIYQRYLRGDVSKLSTYFPEGAVNYGREVGATWVDDWKVRLVDKTAMYEARARASEASEMQFAAAKRRVWADLVEEYGFTDEDELRAYLAERAS